MFSSDLLRLDSVILFLLEGDTRPVGAGEVGDALSDLGIDVPTFNVNRELRSMQDKALITCTGWSLRHGRHRMRTFQLTDTGRAVAARRRVLFERILHDPPKVLDPTPISQAEGWQ